MPTPLQTPPGNPTALPKPAIVLDNARGISWMLLSVLASSAMALSVRAVSTELDSRMIVLLRSGLTLFGLVLVALTLTRWRRALRFTVPGLHILRGVLIAVSMHLGFYTMANLPLATATVLFFTAPIFATLFAALFQGERVGRRRIAATAMGFAGALIILRPGVAQIEPAMLTALGSSVLFAGALTLSRKVAAADGAEAALFSSVLITVIFSVPIALPVLALPGSGILWSVVAVMVLAGVVRNISDIKAYSLGEASVLAPLSYLRLVVVAITAYLLFGEVVDLPTIAGAAIIVAATLYIARREAQLSKLKVPSVP